jgi:ATP-binding cassette subfamily B protein
VAGRELLASVIAAGPTADLTRPLITGAVLVVMLGVINLAGSVAAGRDDILSELLNRHVTRLILDVVSSSDLEDFERPAFHDRLERAITSAESRPYQIAQGLGSLISALLATAGVAVALATIHPLLVVVTMLAVVPLWIAGVKSGQLVFAMLYQLTPAERERRYLTQVQTRRDSAPEVRAYALAAYLRARWERRTTQRLTEIRRMVATRLRVTLLARLGSGAVVGAVLGVLVVLALTDRVDVAGTGAAAGAVLLLAGRLRTASMGTDLLFEAAPFMADLEEFVGRAGAPPTNRPGGPGPVGFRHLTAEGLRFTYPSADRPALDGVDIEIRAGETIALVGENGSGKSTLAKLLSHLYRPQGGHIRYDGVDVTHADPDRLRGSIAVMFQDFQRYPLPAAENIRIGRSDRTDDGAGGAIVQAATVAGAHGFITALPWGYDTLLGPEFMAGTDLSGGQWQRLAIARAFFRDAPFVILDEPTAMLDARAEHDLFERLRALRAGRTVLLISHRFSSVRSADRIYVLADGRVAEHGTHDELMALGGRYAELFTLQAAPYVDVS